MFFSEHRLKMTSLRIGKHRIVKNIASLRKVNIAHPYILLDPIGPFVPASWEETKKTPFQPVHKKSEMTEKEEGAKEKELSINEDDLPMILIED